jgi:hypothetical protein
MWSFMRHGRGGLGTGARPRAPLIRGVPHGRRLVGLRGVSERRLTRGAKAQDLPPARPPSLLPADWAGGEPPRGQGGQAPRHSPGGENGAHRTRSQSWCASPPRRRRSGRRCRRRRPRRAREHERPDSYGTAGEGVPLPPAARRFFRASEPLAHPPAGLLGSAPAANPPPIACCSRERRSETGSSGPQCRPPRRHSASSLPCPLMGLMKSKRRRSASNANSGASELPRVLEAATSSSPPACRAG